MIVVADSSPIHYLVLIDQISLLPTLYERIIAPAAVIEELAHARAPVKVRHWLTNKPSWLEVVREPVADAASLAYLGAGERNAISLAQRIQADAVLMDDRDARAEADRMGLRIIGTLAVLVDAAERRLLDLPAAVTLLRQTSFRASPKLLREILARSPRR